MKVPAASGGAPGCGRVPEARQWQIGGRVQGVGFRPFVYRLALARQLTGWVRNRVGVVEILGQGETAQLDAFIDQLLQQPPAIAQPVLLQVMPLALTPLTGFSIAPSLPGDRPRIHLPPDFFCCPDCLRELQDPADRRFAYPFTNCTQCGPRYTLIRALPYDRPNTSMADFSLCPECAAEYADPHNRRFHAQPLACPACGPHLIYADHQGLTAQGAEALTLALQQLNAGAIVAVKGVGGYHLLCSALSQSAIARLRHRKARPHKPLALLLPLRGADGLDEVRARLVCDDAAAALLLSPARPIVLLRPRAPTSLAPQIAPGLRELGVMLPYSPLHSLLLDGCTFPLVATSGNLSGEPVLTDEQEAARRLAPIADVFLHHNRPIVRPADDSVYRPIAGLLRPLRIGRGLAPLELRLPGRLREPLLAVGGQMKNTLALAWDDRVVMSPHIGDLDSPRGLDIFQQVGADVQRLYQVRAARLACDAHSGYAASRWARDSGLPVQPIWHHQAHAASLCLEVGTQEPLLVFTWDGVGLGPDGTLWGGEALWGKPGHWQRLASFRSFSLPGAEAAARQPWRSALGLCWEIGRDAPDEADHALLRQAWARGLQAPQTSAVGRLLDGVAALTGVVRDASYEGQGPMLLEAACGDCPSAEALPLRADRQGIWRADWEPLVEALLDRPAPTAQQAAWVHEVLAQTLVAQARKIREWRPVLKVGLAGGVFQNALLSARAFTLLRTAGFEPVMPQRLPMNDAGLCVGQVMEVLARDGTTVGPAQEGIGAITPSGNDGIQ